MSMRRRSGCAVAVAAIAFLLPALAVPARGAQVVFVVEAPASTPASAPLYLCGDRAELGAWNGSGLKLEPAGAGQWRGSVVMPDGAAFEFKLTRGSWDTVEKDAQGGEVGNRRAVVGDGDTVHVVVAAWRDRTEHVSARAHTLLGQFKRHDAFASTHVPARDVIVWLPPGYDAPADAGHRYPVIYFHDGQNVFDGATSFIPAQEWRADETADSLIRNHRVPPFIMVGIANTPQRMSEYTRVRDDRNGGGGQAAYDRFLIEELKPFVDATYRTRTKAVSTGIVGSSLGGLAAISLGLLHSDVFGLVGCVSPSVWWGNGEVVRFVQSGSGHPVRLWLDMGMAEGRAVMPSADENLIGARALRDACLARGWREGADLRYLEAPGAGHNERAWAQRLPSILEFLLSGAAR